MSLRFLGVGGAKTQESEHPSVHSFMSIWRAGVWMAHHRQFCNVGYVLCEYAAKVALLRLPPEQQARCVHLLSEMGVDVANVSMGTVLKAVVVPPSAPTSAMAALLEACEAIVDLGERVPEEYQAAGQTIQRWGKSAMEAYLRSNPHGVRHS
jgi:hypothetical protein